MFAVGPEMPRSGSSWPQQLLGTSRAVPDSRTEAGSSARRRAAGSNSEPGPQAVTTACVRQWGCRCPVRFWTGSVWTGRSGAPGPARGHPISDEIVNPDNVGRRQYFTGATIYWRLNEAYAIGGAIRDKWGTTGWEQGWLGYPSSDEVVLPDGAGRMNGLEGGAIYWSPTTDAHPVAGLILAQWSREGYERSSWGYPVTDEYVNDGWPTRGFQFQVVDYGPSLTEVGTPKKLIMYPGDAITLSNSVSKFDAALSPNLDIPWQWVLQPKMSAKGKAGPATPTRRLWDADQQRSY
jgi:hypothetical protein